MSKYSVDNPSQELIDFLKDKRYKNINTSIMDKSDDFSDNILNVDVNCKTYELSSFADGPSSNEESLRNRIGDKFVKLKKYLRLKGIDKIHYNSDKFGDFIKLPELWEPNIIDELYTNTEIEYVAFIKNSNKNSNTVLDNGLTVMNFFNSDRSYVIETNGTLYISKPYYITNEWINSENPSVDDIEVICGKGFLRNKQVTITHLVAQ